MLRYLAHYDFRQRGRERGHFTRYKVMNPISLELSNQSKG
ncbi:protein of unknown function [Pseudodesulfovibrio piezophilus C1TLV30]|uniref:Uncharacterized protein n=1 Tax=Pseudodesulfovibrio piezophilus (strain DSM 21447 / JCM 15486 / C1TLV30) TaxID=1322246 RepID=M1WJD9_PSEP2|nr:protein of unknown function [Pseudodesulfovibrio piezophilus C1TLV30]